MATFYWAGGAGDMGAASNWRTQDSSGSLEPATTLPGSGDIAAVNLAGTLLGLLTAAQLDIDATATIDATTTLGSGAAIGNTAAATVYVTGGTWDDTGGLVVGNTAAGVLDVTGGTLTTGGSLDAIGGSAGVQGTATITGAGWTLDNDSNLTVGDFGNGQLLVGPGGAVQFAGGPAGLYDDDVDVALSAGSTGTVTVNGGTLDGGAGDIGVGLGGAGTLVVEGGGTVLASAAAYGAGAYAFYVGLALNGTASGNGNVTVSGPDSQIDADGQIGVADSEGGTLVITLGAQVDSTVTSEPALYPNVLIGVTAGATGDVTVETDAVFNAGSGALAVGMAGTGTLDVLAGGTVLASNAEYGTVVEGALVLGWGLAATPGVYGTGVVTVEGIGAVIEADGQIQVGELGTGTLTVGQFGTVEVTGTEPNTDASVVIGDAASSATGDVQVAGGLLDAGGGRISVGDYGSGTLDVTQAGTVLASAAEYTDDEAAFQAGRYTGGSGTVLVEGASVQVDGAAVLGVAGTAAVTISAAGTFAITGTLPDGDANIVIGQTSGGSGNVLVTGSGALLTAGAGRLVVGDGGTGTLTVSQGGTVLASAAEYTDTEPALLAGNTAGSVGAVTLEGVGATLAVSGAAWIGGSGSGSLFIGLGGRVTAGGTNDGGTGLVVDQAGGTGVLQVFGGTLVVSDSASIGADGLLSVGVGGSVAIGGNLTLDGTLLEDPASTIDIGGGAAARGVVTVAAGHTLGGAGLVEGTVANDGVVAVAGGTMVLADAVTGTGAITVAAGATLLADGAIGAGQTVTLGAGGTLQLIRQGSGSTQSFGFAGTLDLAQGDETIAVDGLVAGAGASIEGSSLVFGVDLNGTTTLETIALAGFAASGTVGISGTDITVGVPTYYWAGGAGSLDVAANWQTMTTGGTLATAAAPPIGGTTGEVAVAGTLLGSVALYALDIDAAASIDASTTLGIGAYIGNAAPGTVTVDGGSWDDTGALMLGNGRGAGGVLDILAGATVAAGGTAGGIGNAYGELSTLAVSGTGSDLAVTETGDSAFIVGDAGAGTLTIGAGATASTAAAFVVVGGPDDGSGAVTVSGAGATWAVTVGSEGLAIGWRDAGSVLVSQGATMSVAGGDGAQIGMQDGTGSVTVDGAGSTLQLATFLDVGLDGRGALTVSDGAQMTVDGDSAADNLQGWSFIGLSTDAGGSMVTVTGTGSELTFQGPLGIGKSVAGFLDVLNGGEVDFTTLPAEPGVLDSLVIGDGTGNAITGLGVVTVNGGTIDAGSNDIVVGLNGDGTLSVSHAGTVEAAYGLVVAASLGSTGTVAVTGAGSTLTAGGELTIGGGYAPGGQAVVIASNGGAILTVSPLYLYQHGTIAVDASSRVEIGGTSGGVAGTIVVDAGGTIWGAGLVAGPLANSGTLDASGGTLELLGAVSGTGSGTVAQGATLQADAAVGAGQTYTLDAGSTLQLLRTGSGPSQSLPFLGTLDLAAGDATIAVDGLVGADGAAIVNGDALTFQVTLDGSPHLESIALAGVPPGVAPVVIGDDIVIPCYAAGTRIATARGPVAVERLRVGEAVVTVSGRGPAQRPVRWIGEARIDLARHPQPMRVAPVRIRAGAFGLGVPQRDLLLSPDHAVFLGGALIPVRLLLNGATILQERPAGRVRYLHVELDAHDVLLAEGLPAESYLDTGNRAAFANGGPVRALHPDFSARCWDARGCAPLLLDGPRVDAPAAALRARAEALGYALTDDPALRVLVGGVQVPVAPLPDGIWCALLPSGTRQVRLLSRVAVPEHQDRAADDRRCLGIALTGISLDGAPLPLGDAALAQGFHKPESDGHTPWRWTDGDAVLRLPPRRGPAVLGLHTQPWARYWRPPRGLDAPTGLVA